MRPLVFADFNGMSGSRMALTGYGTLASLSQQQIRLEEGMQIRFFDSDGTYVDATIVYLPGERKNADSGWYAESDGEVFYGEERAVEPVHPCFKCRMDLEPHLEKVGRTFQVTCPACGTSVMYPMNPPD